MCKQLVLEIRTCPSCPEFHMTRDRTEGKRFGWPWYCRKQRTDGDWTEIREEDGIWEGRFPSWCPLPDAKRDLSDD